MAYVFRYRLPETTQPVSGSSNRCLQLPQGDGFLITPFIPHSPMLFIPRDEECGNETIPEAVKENGDGTMFAFPERSTTRDEHRAEVEEIIRLENCGELTKAVAARCLVKETAIDVADMFDSLCSRYPDAFVFLFSTPESGTWIGATPEVLLINKEGRMRTMALAGTRPAGTPGDWDCKNLREQAVVTEYIRHCFTENGLDVCTEGPVTVKAGPVEHLKTDISCNAKESADMQGLLDSLAPTPAVCGMPREPAAETIARCEEFERGFYGGFCGPWHSDREFSLYVILRCARVSTNSVCLFAGGGIMPDSVPEDEWRETEAKLSTINTMNNNNN